MTQALSILGTGMVTAVGLDAASSCAAMRARLDGFQETRFIIGLGTPVVGAPVPLPHGWIGARRLAHLAAGALVDLAGRVAFSKEHTAIILCLAENDRPGRLSRNPKSLAEQMLRYAGWPPHSAVHIIEHGRPSGFVALQQARRLLSGDKTERVVVIGVDSLLSGPAITHYFQNARILTAENPNGFIPGEAAAAFLCSADVPVSMAMTGVGLARELAYLYNPDDMPLRGDGITQAYRDALGEAGLTLGGIEYRISDLIGESYFFKQAALATLRLERGRSAFQDLWSPGESLGNVGAAVVPLMIGMAEVAAKKGYDGGTPFLIEASSDQGACGAAVFHSRRAA